jgi:hypothetical protein
LIGRGTRIYSFFLNPALLARLAQNITHYTPNFLDRRVIYGFRKDW